MNEPAPFERARAVKAFAKGTVGELAVVLSQQEAFEVLDYLEATASPTQFDLVTLGADIHEARMSANPWLVLDHFTIEGVSMTKRIELH